LIKILLEEVGFGLAIAPGGVPVIAFQDPKTGIEVRIPLPGESRQKLIDMLVVAGSPVSPVVVAPAGSLPPVPAGFKG
jgi:hypothetical protein